MRSPPKMKWMYFTLLAQLLMLLAPGAQSRPSSAESSGPTTPATPATDAAASALPIVQTSVSAVLANDTVIANQFIDHLNLTHVGAQSPNSAAAASAAATAVTNRRYVSSIGDVALTIDQASRQATTIASSTMPTIFGGSLDGKQQRGQRQHRRLSLLTHNPDDSETDTDALQYDRRPSPSIAVDHTFADYDRTDNRIVNEFLAVSISDLNKNFSSTVIHLPPSAPHTSTEADALKLQAPDESVAKTTAKTYGDTRDNNATSDDNGDPATKRLDHLHHYTETHDFFETDSSATPNRYYEYDLEHNHHKRPPPTDKLYFEPVHGPHSEGGTAFIVHATQPTSVDVLDVETRPWKRKKRPPHIVHIQSSDDDTNADDDDQYNLEAENIMGSEIVVYSTTQRPAATVSYVNNKITIVKKRPTKPKPPKRPDGTKHAGGCRNGVTCIGSTAAGGGFGGGFAAGGGGGTNVHIGITAPPPFPTAPSGPTGPSGPSGPTGFPAPSLPPAPPIPSLPIPTVPNIPPPLPTCALGFFFNPNTQQCVPQQFGNAPPPVIPGQFTGPGFNIIINDKHQHNSGGGSSGHQPPSNTQIVPTFVYQPVPQQQLQTTSSSSSSSAHQKPHTDKRKKKKDKKKKRDKKRKNKTSKKKIKKGIIQSLMNLSKFKLWKLIPILAVVNPLTFGFWTLLLSPLLVTMAVGTVITLFLYATPSHSPAPNNHPIIIYQHHTRRPRIPTWHSDPWRAKHRRYSNRVGLVSRPKPMPRIGQFAAATTQQPVIQTSKRQKFPLRQQVEGIRNRSLDEGNYLPSETPWTQAHHESDAMWRNFTQFQEAFVQKHLMRL